MGVNLRDKVWIVFEGKKCRGDVSRIKDATGATIYDVNVHKTLDADETGTEHHVLVGGVTDAKLVAAESTTEGQFWPRAGKYAFENGKRKWEGE